MNYKLIQPAVEKILEESNIAANGQFGWKGPLDLSRTITAQVITTLSSIVECEENAVKKQAITNAIDEAFKYLKSAIKANNSEITTYTFTLIAHLEHVHRFRETNGYDFDLIMACLDGLGHEDFYKKETCCYHYKKNSTDSYFATYLALISYLRLLKASEKEKDLLKALSITETLLMSRIDECFTHIYTKFQGVIVEVDKSSYESIAKYFSLALNIGKYYEEYSTKHKRIISITEPKKNLNIIIEYFSANIDALYKSWFITIEDGAFKLVYISNLISGLLKYRNELPVAGIELLYKLSNFITTDNRIQNFDQDRNIISTAMPGAPVWATAHSLNAIVKLEFSVSELIFICERIDRQDEKTQLDKEGNKLATALSSYAKYTWTHAFVPIFITAISAYIMEGYFSGRSQFNQIILYHLILIVSIGIFYLTPIVAKTFVPSLIDNYKKHHNVVKSIEVTAGIIAYLLAITYYIIVLTTKH